MSFRIGDEQFAAASKAVSCTECGAPMRERLRWHQAGVLYVWRECTRDTCSARTLEKRETGATSSLRQLKTVTRAALLA